MTREELERLYRQYGPLIHDRCCRLLGDGAAAEDATQETFVRVHQHLARAPRAEEAVAWIYRIATNHCLNELRNRNRRAVPVADLPEGAPLDAERLLLDRDLAARLITRAPPKLRDPAWLHYVDGLDQGEVARVLGVSRRTVVSRLGEFLARAYKFLARDEGD